MMKSLFSLIIAITFFHGVASADWPCRTDSSVTIAADTGNQWNPRVISDRKNGAIMVWQDRRNGTSDQLYMQRVNSAGVALWQAGGIQLAATGGYQYYPQMIADGLGGAFVVWQDNRSGLDYDIFVQRVNSSGVPLWSSNGTAVCTATGHQYNPQIVSDGFGGVVVAWQDRRSGQFDIYAQRLNSTGNALWAANGLAVCTAASDQLEPKLVGDGNGGAIIAWTDYRAGTGATDVYAQRIQFTSQPAWAVDGVPICIAANPQWNIQICSDAAGGAIIAWQDRRNGQTDNIYAQRIDPTGVIRWAVNGIALVTSSGNQFYPQINADGSGGAVAVWQDNRKGSDYDIYAQRLSPNGQQLWTSSGVGMCTALGHQYNPQLILQGSSMIVTWQDRRKPDYDIFAQCSDLNGQMQWAHDGSCVTSASLDQFMPQLASDSLHGCIVVWADYRLNKGATDIFAQRLGSNGFPAGGCFRTFIQDSLARKSKRFKKAHDVVFAAPNAGIVRDSVFGRGVFPNGIVLGIERLDSPKVYGWEYFTKSIYVRRAVPQFSVSRPYDRIFDHAFIGRLKNPGLVRYNNRLAGELLTLKMNIAASDVGITQENLGDLVFKDTAGTDNPLNNKKLRQITTMVDSFLTMYKKYKLNYTQLGSTLHRINGAFDGLLDTVSTTPLRITSTKPLFSCAFLIPSTDVPTVIPRFETQLVDAGLPDDFTLYQNYPNPFNPLTTIEFVIPEASIVTLRVVNILGQEVNILVDHATMDDGHQVFDFDASNLSSGVYFYQLIAEPLSGNGTMNLTKKMMVLK